MRRLTPWRKSMTCSISGLHDGGTFAVCESKRRKHAKSSFAMPKNSQAVCFDPRSRRSRSVSERPVGMAHSWNGHGTHSTAFGSLCGWRSTGRSPSSIGRTSIPIFVWIWMWHIGGSPSGRGTYGVDRAPADPTDPWMLGDITGPVVTERAVTILRRAASHKVVA